MWLDEPASEAPDIPVIVENDQVVSLFFDARSVQSTMLRHDPCALALGYTRTMMGFLLFQPSPRRISMIGLGGGSLVRYCYRYLPETVIAAVEINPAVIALRDVFQLPADDGRFSVVCADGAEYVNIPGHRPDVLLVDGFGAHGMPAGLGTHGFYEACRRRLGDDGVMVVNLVTDEPHFHRYLRALRDVFGGALALVPAQGSDYNVIAFAWKGARELPSRALMRERARALARSHQVDMLAIVAAFERGAGDP
ncbi:spermidine synthase [Paraburkholderia sp. J12]|uniref:spermine/spermidine synthase domain-containing protein n=1 Tax=Paraburkholderia sp. J12 TaxID=2805432 RepID=UPI002ABE1B5E|nr:spermidine synthase [Paraburkholderia sp. J12]